MSTKACHYKNHKIITIYPLPAAFLSIYLYFSNVHVSLYPSAKVLIWKIPSNSLVERRLPPFPFRVFFAIGQVRLGYIGCKEALKS